MSREEDEHEAVELLAALMMKKLRANAHKPNWRPDTSGTIGYVDTVHGLRERLGQELVELDEELRFFAEPMSARALNERTVQKARAMRIANECADIANFAAMIVDVLAQVSLIDRSGYSVGPRWAARMGLLERRQRDAINVLLGKVER